MQLEFFYEFGRQFAFGPELKGVDKKLKLMEFPYTSKEILTAAIIVVAVSSFFATLFLMIFPFLGWIFAYFGAILAIVLYVYPTSIFYSQRLIDYKEEMLRAIMRISTFISMDTSMEYAVMQTVDQVSGTLRKQFADIGEKLKLRERDTLGEVFEEYIPLWNSVNPDFTKALKLLQTASMSEPEERDEIIEEVLESIILSYHTQGKRSSEELASKTKTLLAIGVLIPVISLMIVPLVSIFMPDIVSPPILIFVYNILFPTFLLLMAFDFSSRRVQVDTIKLDLSPQYQQLSYTLYIFCAIVVIVIAIPTFTHVMSIDMSTEITAQREYELMSIIICWVLGAGIVAAIYIFTHYYIKRYKTLWNEVYMTEQDLPFILQTFNTYLSLNRSLESILPEVVDDYKTHGFGDHPIVRVFTEIYRRLLSSKRSIMEITRNTFYEICPSKKVSDILTQIISFTEISQKSAARVSKMIYRQVVSINKLDDYIKSLLSETVGLVQVTISMLAPLLCAAAVVMSVAIVMSLQYITEQLNLVSEAFGTTIDMKLVDVGQVIPPTIIEIVVSVYLLETMVILAIFASSIKIGNDKYQIIKNVNSIWFGFMVYTLILFAGFFLFKSYVFEGIIGAG